MNKEDWERLDDLLHKEGFGGYYDLLELLKGYIQSWYKDKFGLAGILELEYRLDGIKTIHQATSILSFINLTKNQNGK